MPILQLLAPGVGMGGSAVTESAPERALAFPWSDDTAQTLPWSDDTAITFPWSDDTAQTFPWGDDVAQYEELQVHQGEDVLITGSEVGGTAGLTGDALLFRVYDAADTTIFSKTTVSGITISGGEPIVDIDAADTTSLSGKYNYTLARTDSGNQAILAVGIFEVLATPIF